MRNASLLMIVMLGVIGCRASGDTNNNVDAKVNARAESLPTLTIIANNQSWHAVRASTLDVFPGGVVRIIPGGDGPAEFTMYDGTRLAWDGATTLRVSANARPRAVELRLPDGTTVVQRITNAQGAIRAE